MHLVHFTIIIFNSYEISFLMSIKIHSYLEAIFYKNEFNRIIVCKIVDNLPLLLSQVHGCSLKHSHPLFKKTETINKFKGIIDI